MILFENYLVLCNLVLTLVGPVRSEFQQAVFSLRTECRGRGLLPQTTTRVLDVRYRLECLVSCLDDNSCVNVAVVKSSYITCNHGNVSLSENCEPSMAGTKSTSIHVVDKQVIGNPCQHGGTFVSSAGGSCLCQGGYIGSTCERLAEDCAEMGEFPCYVGQEGYFQIHPSTAPNPFMVLCTFVVSAPRVYIQRHFSGATEFGRPWDEYRDGFTLDAHNFWLGNKQLHYLTRRYSHYRLVIEFIGKDWATFKQKAYLGLRVRDEAENFAMTFEQAEPLGRDDAGDSLTFVNGSSFTTKDKDNGGIAGTNCAVLRGCGFWFTEFTMTCGHANPNGKLVQTVDEQRVGEQSEIFWTYDLGTWSPWHVQMWLERPRFAGTK